MPRPSSHPNPRGRQPATHVPSLREARYSQSLERGLAILRAFTPQRPVLGIAEIAGELGMSRSTTHRYATTLLALGYLEQDTSRKYRLGLPVTQLGTSALRSTPLHEQARPYLEELRGHFPYTCNLGVLDGQEVVLVHRLRGRRQRRRSFELALGAGSRVPAHCTAIGKLLLAYLPEPEQGELLSSLSLTRWGPHTITSCPKLRAELKRIRERGIATSSEEIAPRLQAIAAPVRDHSGDVVAAVNLVADREAIGLAQLVEHASPPLQHAAERISERLGGLEG